MVDSSTRCGDAASYTERFEAPEEAALLVCAGRWEPAEAVLRAALAGPRASVDGERCGLMLLELLHMTNRRREFDEVLARHREAFPASAPQWGWPKPVGAAGTFVLKGVIGDAPGDLDELAHFACERRTLVIDVSEVERVRFDFLLRLQAVLRVLSTTGKRVIIANASETLAVLLDIVGAGKQVAIMRRRAAPALAVAA